MTTIEGYLLKDSGWRKGWRKRYFRLSNIYFQYFENQDCTSPKSAEVRGSISNVEVIDLSKFHFKVSFKSDSWDLQASNRQELIKWMETLKPRSAQHLINQPAVPQPTTTLNNVTSYVPEQADEDEAHYQAIPPAMHVNPRFRNTSSSSGGARSPSATAARRSYPSPSSTPRSLNSSVRSHNSSVRSTTSTQGVTTPAPINAPPPTLGVLDDDDDEFLDFEESSYMNQETIERPGTLTNLDTLKKDNSLDTPTNGVDINIIPTTPVNTYSSARPDPYLVPDCEDEEVESLPDVTSQHTIKSKGQTGVTYTAGFIHEESEDDEGGVEVDGDIDTGGTNTASKFTRIKSQEAMTNNHTLQPQTSQGSFLASPRSPTAITTLKIQEWMKKLPTVEKTFVDPDDLGELDTYLLNNTTCLPQESIVRIQKIGNGAFGEVWKGRNTSSHLTLPPGQDLVAVKTLKSGSSEKHRRDFYGEAALLGQFQHPNVISLHGVILREESPWIIIEYAEHGALKSFLRKVGDQRHPNQLLSYCRDIIQGMSYLSDKGYIHRDLAARNVLVSRHEECKIADFGLSRKLDGDDDVYVSRGGMVAIKWTAPEGVLGASYSSASDVWSAGVTMWEVFSEGANPFSGKSNEDAFRYIRKGGRLAQPERCPVDVFKVMLQCWHGNPCERPTFGELERKLHDLNTDTTEQPLYENTDGFVTYVNMAYENMPDVEKQE